MKQSEKESLQGLQFYQVSFGGFLKWWVSPTGPLVFPTKNDQHLGCEMGHHLRKHPFQTAKKLSKPQKVNGVKLSKFPHGIFGNIFTKLGSCLLLRDLFFWREIGISFMIHFMKGVGNSLSFTANKCRGDRKWFLLLSVEGKKNCIWIPNPLMEPKYH